MKATYTSLLINDNMHHYAATHPVAEQLRHCQ